MPSCSLIMTDLELEFHPKTKELIIFIYQLIFRVTALVKICFGDQVSIYLPIKGGFLQPRPSQGKYANFARVKTISTKRLLHGRDCPEQLTLVTVIL